MASPIATTSRLILGKATTAFSAAAASRTLSTAPSFAKLSATLSDATTLSDTATLSDAAPTTTTTNEPSPSPSISPSASSSIPADEEVTARRLRQAMIHQLTPLGSPQNRDTSFRPHKTRLNPIDAHNLTLGHLMAATAEVGHSLASLKQGHQPYIYGKRHNVAIFDLEKATLPALRRAASVVKAIAQRDGIILFVGTRPGQQAAVLAACKRLQGNGFHVTAERWIPGVITNAPKLLASAILKTINDEKNVPNTNQLASQTFQPDLVIVLNPIENASAIREATQTNIPTIAITDSDVDPRSVTYPIPANDDSIRSVELIIGILSKAGQEGIKIRNRNRDQAAKIERKIQRRSHSQPFQQHQQQQETNLDPRKRGPVDFRSYLKQDAQESQQ